MLRRAVLTQTEISLSAIYSMTTTSSTGLVSSSKLINSAKVREDLRLMKM